MAWATTDICSLSAHCLQGFYLHASEVNVIPIDTGIETVTEGSTEEDVSKATKLPVT